MRNSTKNAHTHPLLCLPRKWDQHMCPKSVSLMFQILAEQETARFLPFRNFRLIVTTLYNYPTLETKNYTIKKMKKYDSTIRLPYCSAQPTWPWWCSRPQEWWALPIQPIAQVSAPPQPPLPTSSDLGLTEKNYPSVRIDSHSYYHCPMSPPNTKFL